MEQCRAALNKIVFEFAVLPPNVYIVHSLQTSYNNIFGDNSIFIKCKL